MNWRIGSKQGEAKKRIAHLADATQRERAAQDLIRLGVDAVPPLLEVLQTKNESLLPSYQQILARIPAATPELIKTLREAHPILRGRAAEVFALSKDRAAVPALLEALQGEYYTVRSRAALALGRIGDPRAISRLIAALKDPEEEVRAAACLGLGFFRDPSTFDDITNVLLDDSSIGVRQAAARALGNTELPSALPYLLEALHDSFWWYEREYAASDLLAAIEKMGQAAVDPLIQALQDREGTVRKFAAILLGRLQDKRAVEPLGMALYDLHHEVGKAAADSLAAFGASSVDVLAEALSHPEMWIRIHSVLALSKIKGPHITPLLVQMLTDPEREVKKHVIRALGELRDARAGAALQEIASNRADRELHTLAKAAISKMNGA